MIRAWMRRRWFRDAKALAHADANMLAFRYWGTPVPFWPTDFPTELEGVPNNGAAALPAE